jgi:hypothetical protein
VSIGLILVCGIVLSGAEGTEIDKETRTYRDYKSFFFLKSGSTEKFTAIEKIFVSTSTKKQRVYYGRTNQSSIFEFLEYNGFLKFSDGTKIQLLQKRRKSDLIKALEKIAKFLDVPLEDNTGVPND